jgi:hypothetical protein
MYFYDFKNYLAIICFIGMGVMLMFAEAGCQGPDANLLPAQVLPPKAQVDAKLNTRLSALVAIYEAKGNEAALDAAGKAGIQTSGGMVRVIIEATSAGKAGVAAAVKEIGGKVEADDGTLIQALVPVGQLKILAGFQDVALIRLPVTAFPSRTSGPSK